MRKILSTLIIGIGVIMIGCTSIKAEDTPSVDITMTEWDGEVDSGRSKVVKTYDEVDRNGIVTNLQLKLNNNTGINGSLRYQCHYHSTGWTAIEQDNSKTQGSVSTDGRITEPYPWIEAVSIWFEGDLSDYYWCSYNAYAQKLNYGSFYDNTQPDYSYPAGYEFSLEKWKSGSQHWNSWIGILDDTQIIGSGVIPSGYSRGNGYNFAGSWGLWIPITGLEVSIKPYNMKLTIDPNGGEYDGNLSSTTKDIQSNENYIISVPTRSGYTFKGWTITNTAIISKAANGNQLPSSNREGSINDGILSTGNMDIKLVANWEANKYKLTIDPNRGTYNDYSGTFQFQLKTDATDYNAIGKAKRTGYKFTGWGLTKTSNNVYDNNGEALKGDYWTDNGTSARYKKDGDLYVYALWNPIKYTITYNGNGNTGGSTSSTPATYDKEVALMNNGFTRQFKIVYDGQGATTQSKSKESISSTFLNWKYGTTNYAEGQNVKNLTSKDGDIIKMKAIWRDNSVTTPKVERKYKITYNKNTEDECSISNYSENVYYSMLGWYNSIDGGDKRASKGGKYTPYKDETLYARWQSMSTKLPSPTRDSYEFLGWYSDKECTQKIGDGGEEYTPTKDIVLYAKWKKTVTLTFDMNGGQYKGSGNSIVLKGDIYNDTNYYEFSINGDMTNSTVNNSEQKGKVEAYGSGFSTNGVNNDYTKITYIDGTDSQIVWRFLGWSSKKYNSGVNGATINGQVSNYGEPEESKIINYRKGQGTYSLCTYNSNRAEKIGIYTDTKLYAVWEPVLGVYSSMERTLGGKVEVNLDATNKEYDGGQIGFRTAEKGIVQLNTIGSIKEASISMDDKLGEVYRLALDNSDAFGKYSDILNIAQNDGYASSLDEKAIASIDSLSSKITKIFYIPQYLMEYQRYVDGYTGDKNIYNVYVDVKGNSYYYSKYVGADEEVNVTYSIKVNSCGGEGGEVTYPDNKIDSDLKWRIVMN